MAQLYWTLAKPAIDLVNDDFEDAMAKCKDGFETAITHYSGSTDPSTGASWGVAQVGTLWKDTTDAQNPVWRQWQQLTTAPTYGWRTIRLRKVHMLATPVAVSLASTSPVTADVVYTDEDFTTDLDTVTDNDDMLVIAVYLKVRVRETGTIQTGGTTIGGMFWREKGATVEEAVIPQVANVPNERVIRVELDASEIAQYKIVVGSASPSLNFAVDLIGYEEAI